MSKYHTPSLTVSIAIHVVAVLVVFFIYKSVHTLINKVEKEKRVSINLNICVPKMEETPKEEVKTQKKQLKKVLKKEVQKVKPQIKTKVKPKRVVIKKVSKKIPKEKNEKVMIKEEVIAKKVEPILETQLQVVEKFLIQKPIKKLAVLPQKTTQEIYINNHIKEISQLLSENLYYPRRARKRGIMGEVIVKFTLSKDAIVSDTYVIKSQSELLSRAAIKTIQNLSGKFPKPDEVIILQVPIVFSLK